MGTTNQMRNLGGSISISICANLLSNTLSDPLEKLLSPGQFHTLLGSAEAVNNIPPDLQERVRDAFSSSFTVLAEKFVRESEFTPKPISFIR